MAAPVDLVSLDGKRVSGAAVVSALWAWGGAAGVPVYDEDDGLRVAVGDCPACIADDCGPGILSLYPDREPECFERHTLCEIARAAGLVLGIAPPDVEPAPPYVPLKVGPTAEEAGLLQDVASPEQPTAHNSEDMAVIATDKDDTLEDIAARLTEADLETYAASGGFTDVFSLAELAGRPAPTWLVDGLIPAGADGKLVAFAGQNNSGKTFTLLDLALTVATGRGEWLGRPCGSGPVLFIALEAVDDIGPRARAWCEVHRPMAERLDDFHVYDPADGLALGTPAGLGALAERIAALEPVLVILDPWGYALGTVNENKAEEVGPVVRAVRDVLRAVGTGSTFIAALHTGWDNSRERGSIAVRDHADCALLLEAGSVAGRSTLKNTKQRSGKRQDPVELQLADAAGSAVVTFHRPTVFADAAEAQLAAEERVLDVLRQSGTLSGNRLELAAGGKAVETRAARDRLVDRGRIVCVAGERGARLFSLPNDLVPA